MACHLPVTKQQSKWQKCRYNKECLEIPLYLYPTRARVVPPWLRLVAEKAPVQYEHITGIKRGHRNSPGVLCEGRSPPEVVDIDVYI